MVNDFLYRAVVLHGFRFRFAPSCRTRNLAPQVFHRPADFRNVRAALAIDNVIARVVGDNFQRVRDIGAVLVAVALRVYGVDDMRYQVIRA